MKEYLCKDKAYGHHDLGCWYQSSVDDTPPIWTDEHLEELLNDFYVIPKDTPSADVVEVRHGEWKYPPYAPFGGSYEMKRCTVCGYKPDFDTDNPYTKFCPECGAKMDKRRTNND